MTAPATRNIVVADTRKHAQAVVHWLKLDETWQIAAYGDPIEGKFEAARVVRPASGVQQDHYAWIVGILMPRVAESVMTVPTSWAIEELEDTDFEPMRKKSQEMRKSS